MTLEYATRYRRASRIPDQPGKPYFIEKGEGDRAHLFGDLVTIYAGGEQTESTFNFFTCEGPKGDIIPAHLHRDTYEASTSPTARSGSSWRTPKAFDRRRC